MGNKRTDLGEDFIASGMTLITDPRSDFYLRETKSEKRVLKEVMDDPGVRHDFKKQNEIHSKIRNDDDYDDWSYGTEPTYGQP